MQICTNKLQKMPSLNLYFEFSPQNPNFYVDLSPTSVARMEESRSH